MGEEKNGFELYVREWHRMMSKIWLDRLALLGVYHRGSLRESVADAGTKRLEFGGEYEVHATYGFLTYGMFVDAGTGKYYKRGNGGDLKFLDKKYRAERGYGKMRERRPWFSVSWDISRRVLVDRLGQVVGGHFLGILASMR